MTDKKGQFIVFEGIDGSGKTTISRMLQAYLQKNNIDSVWLREPSDSIWGNQIRRLAITHDSFPAKKELALFIKDRQWDVKHNIKPALGAGKTVVMDRYYLSTACYQGARGLDMADIIADNRRFAPNPDITFVIDVSVDVGLTRIAQNRKLSVKLFEKNDFLLKVRQNYLSMIDNDILIINGEKSPGDVFTDVLVHLQQRKMIQAERIG